MATLNFEVIASDGTSVAMKTATVAEVDVARLLAAYGSMYAAADMAFNPTPANIVSKWIDGLIKGSLAFVEGHEKTVARQAAEASIAAIQVSIS